MELKFDNIEEAVTLFGEDWNPEPFNDLFFKPENFEKISFKKTVDDSDFMETLESPLIDNFGDKFRNILKKVKNNLGKIVYLANHEVGELIGFEITMGDYYYVVRDLRLQVIVNDIKYYKRTSNTSTITACCELVVLDSKSNKIKK